MIPVYIGDAAHPDGYSFEHFRNHFLEICRSHQVQNRARAFAFILHDLQHPEIEKILRDEYYWAALNEISGHYLTVFYVHTSAEQDVPPVTPRLEWMSALRSTRERRPSSNHLADILGFDKPLRLPAILFFQVAGERVVGHRLATIPNPCKGGAFPEIRRTIETAASTIAKQPYGAHQEEVFEALETALRNDGLKVQLRRIGTAVKSAAEIANLAVSIARITIGR